MSPDQCSGQPASGPVLLSLQIQGLPETRWSNHTDRSLLLAAESTLNWYARFLLSTHLHFWVLAFLQPPLCEGVCELRVRTNPSKETSIKTNPHLGAYLYSRGGDAQQVAVLNGFTWIRIWGSLSMEAQPPGLLPTQGHHQFHCSLTNKLCRSTILAPGSWFVIQTPRIWQPSTL